MKQHDDPTLEDLILYHYGESPDAAAIEARLEVSEEARRRHADFRAVLAVVDSWQPPPPPADFTEAVWRRLQPELEAAHRTAEEVTRHGSPVLGGSERFPVRGRRWLLAAAAAGLILAVGYLGGRLTSPAPAPDIASPAAEVFSAAARDRLLVRALAEHLERSQRLFTELSNASAERPEATVDSAWAQRVGRELLSANRLYRAATIGSEHRGLAALLDAMEPVLLDVAHLPADPSPEDLELLKERIDSRGLLFKTRVATEPLTRSLSSESSPRSRSTI